MVFVLGEAERVMVLISQDGVQRPPIRFPTTGSLMRFLECLETGLVPYGRLDPPITNERGDGILFDKPASKGSLVKYSLPRDYVFRLVPSVKPEDIGEWEISRGMLKKLGSEGQKKHFRVTAALCCLCFFPAMFFFVVFLLFVFFFLEKCRT